MKHLARLLILCIVIVHSTLFIGTAYGQGPILGWASAIGGTSDDEGFSTTVDDSGNVYTTGYFQGMVDFDPGPDTFNLTAVSGLDIFISKLDASGNFLWTVTMGGAFYDQGKGITIDDSGNVYTTGRFSGTVDFDPGPDTFNLSTGGNFISKLGAAGNFIWAVVIPGFSANDHSIAVDNWGNVYTTGYFNVFGDFDPGPSTFNLTPIGDDDFYICKLDPSGNFLWAVAIGSPSAIDRSNSIAVDDSGNVYTTGFFRGTADFDPGPAVFNLTSFSSFMADMFVSKLDASGNFRWAVAMRGVDVEVGNSIDIDNMGNIYTTGYFQGTVDFDPGPGVFNLSSIYKTPFISKLDAAGDFQWATTVTSGPGAEAFSIAIDTLHNVYTTGTFTFTGDFDPGLGTFNLTSAGQGDIFISKLDPLGNFLWAVAMGGAAGSRNDYGVSIDLDALGNVYTTGRFRNSGDFDPGSDIFNLTAAGGWDIFILKLQQRGVVGFVFNDVSGDCERNSNEIGLEGRRLTINPGNIVVQTNASGFWNIDSLPANTYTITADTSGNWQLTCPAVQTFTVTDPNGLTYAPFFGFVSTQPCASPEVSIHAPFLRPCFSNQNVFVQACNQNIATGVLDSAYVEVTLDALLTLQSATLPYIDLGANMYRFDVGGLNPGMCTSFTLSCILSCNATLGQTLCMQADIYPADSCVFDTLPSPTGTGVLPCALPWDNSNLRVESSCINDSIRFVVYNTSAPGIGDMNCFSAIRLYIDGQFILLDSVQLLGGDSALFVFSGDGRTWRLEADQHPLHPGNSHPNASLELCGNINNWTSDLINLFPMDDADPVTDIYCGLVTGSFDPNDKTGYPLGLTDSNYIAPNQEIQYVIRFQNTGTDTAFTVVIRDTLTANLDIFSVISGVASDNYTFRMYGPRVLEWTFDNILLPDSNTNELESHGFVTFTVAQNSNLPNGVMIQNAADIYFDFNAPVITNLATHTVNDGLKIPQLAGPSTVIDTACGTYELNGFTYHAGGMYMQNIVSSGGLDSIVTLNLTSNNTSATINPVFCQNYTVPSGDESYSVSGIYTDTVPNIVGCDSIITINLSISNSTGIINSVACASYTVPSGDETYSVSGTYMDTVLNIIGCDSILTIILDINNTSATLYPVACTSYTVPSEAKTYTVSGLYSDTIPNSAGCDSILTINLVINNTSATISPVACQSYIVPSGDETYAVSGTFMDTIPNIAGCDSILTINLTINNTSATLNQVACSSYTVPSGDETYVAPGTYFDTIPNSAGCDSILTINLAINNSNATLNLSACSSYTVPSGDETYFTSGSYSDTILNTAGCDSILTIILTISNTNANINPSVCGIYTVPSGDETYFISGTYHDTLLNNAGCDSIITINLTINNSTAIINEVACESYTVPSGDETYLISGTYMDTVQNTLGCDSIITINLSLNNASAAIINPVACENYTVPSGDETYTAAGTYSDTVLNSLGCDSILTINLTINNSNATINLVACASYTVPSGDETYTLSGTYMDTVPNSVGCDSIITINLFLNNASSAIINPVECAIYTVPSGDETYTVSGTYTDTLSNSFGCDSIMVINLIVNPLPSVSFNGLDSVYCSTDAKVTMSGSPSGGTFNGTGAVAGNQFFPATGVGSYTVTYDYVDGNGCSNTVSQTVSVNLCTGIEEVGLNRGFEVFPNPNTGIFTMKLDAYGRGMITLTISDILGREIYTDKFNSSKSSFEKQLNLSEFPAGVYTLKLETDKGVLTRKMIKE